MISGFCCVWLREAKAPPGQILSLNWNVSSYRQVVWSASFSLCPPYWKWVPVDGPHGVISTLMLWAPEVTGTSLAFFLIVHWNSSTSTYVWAMMSLQLPRGLPCTASVPLMGSLKTLLSHRGLRENSIVFKELTGRLSKSEQSLRDIRENVTRVLGRVGRRCVRKSLWALDLSWVVKDNVVADQAQDEPKHLSYSGWETRWQIQIPSLSRNGVQLGGLNYSSFTQTQTHSNTPAECCGCTVAGEEQNQVPSAGTGTSILRGGLALWWPTSALSLQLQT